MKNAPSPSRIRHTIVRACFEAVQDSAEEGFHGPDNEEPYCLTDEEREAIINAASRACKTLLDMIPPPAVLNDDLDHLMVERLEAHRARFLPR